MLARESPALMLNALTIDVEDWYHPELVHSRASFNGLGGGSAGPQIEASTGALLDLLRQKGVRATFFVVGEIVQRHPQLIQSIAAQGHELGCHGMGHRPLWELTPDVFRSELEQFAALMSSVVPEVDVVGFRAPTFSLDNRTRWALAVLSSLGYRYDSSIFPMRTPLYGVSGAPLHPYRPSLSDVAAEAATVAERPSDNDGERVLIEFPMTVWSWAGLRLPICGGFYLRAWPLWFVSFALRQVNRQRPFVLYVHPWETFADTPRLALPLLSRFVTYYGLHSMMARLATLLDAFSFAPMRAVLEEMAKSRHPLGEGK